LLDYRFLPLARAEPLEAARFYRTRDVDVAQSFQEDVRRAIDFILIRPKASALVRRRRIRRKILRRFPYSLYYAVKEDFVLIVAVGHHSRRPGYWSSRV